MPTYGSTSELDFCLSELPPLPRFCRVEMAHPEHFDVQYAINPHMLDAQGKLHRVDRKKATQQWSALRQTIEACGVQVTAEAAMQGHPDFVFCANPWLPIPAQVTGTKPHCVPSRMANEQRTDEVAHWCDRLAQRGWSVAPLTGPAERLEGTGDGVWHPRRQLLWGGIGSRTERGAWEELSQRYELPIVLLELTHPDLYHLDTCLAALDERTCLWCPEAFTAAGGELIQHLFEEAIKVTEEEACQRFVCNAYAPDGEGPGRQVLLQAGSQRVIGELTDRGFKCFELDTSEFLKAGGSVFCMKLAHPGP